MEDGIYTMIQTLRGRLLAEYRVDFTVTKLVNLLVAMGLAQWLSLEGAEIRGLLEDLAAKRLRTDSAVTDMKARIEGAPLPPEAGVYASASGSIITRELFETTCQACGAEFVATSSWFPGLRCAECNAKLPSSRG